MANDSRNWLDVRASEIRVQDDWIATQKAGMALLQRVHEEGLRLRLTVSEEADYKPPSMTSPANRSTIELANYAAALHHVVACAEEVIIELMDGRRCRCAGQHLREREFV